MNIAVRILPFWRDSKTVHVNDLKDDVTICDFKIEG